MKSIGVKRPANDLQRQFVTKNNEDSKRKVSTVVEFDLWCTVFFRLKWLLPYSVLPVQLHLHSKMISLDMKQIFNNDKSCFFSFVAGDVSLWNGPQ